MGTWWLSLRNNRNYCSEVWTTFIWPLPNRTKKDRPAFESSHQCRPHFRRSNTCRNHHDHDFANYEQKMIIIVSMIIQLMIKMILMFFQLIIMFRRNHANEDLNKRWSWKRLVFIVGLIVSPATRISRQLPAPEKQIIIQSLRLGEIYFFFASWNPKLGFECPQPRLLVAPCHCGERWWAWGSAWPARRSSIAIFIKISSIFTKISMFMISIQVILATSNTPSGAD